MSNPERWLSGQMSFATGKTTVDTIFLSQQLWPKANKKIVLWCDSKGNVWRSGFYTSSPKGRTGLSQQGLKARLLVLSMSCRLLPAPQCFLFRSENTPTHISPMMVAGGRANFSVCPLIWRPYSTKEILKNQKETYLPIAMMSSE